MIALIKLGLLLLGVVIASVKRVPIYITLISAAIISAFIFLPLGDILTAMGHIFSRWEKTWMFLITLWGVLLLEGTMNKSGMLKALAVSSVSLFSDSRYAAISLPSTIGFIPSVGGAYFSAPLLQEVLKDSDISGDRKAFLNYWYRHIWECAIPLYPGVIMASQITGLSVPKVMLFQVAFIVVGAISGFVVGFRNLAKQPGPGGQLLARVFGFLKYAWPILLAILLVVTLPIYPCWSLLSTVLILWVFKFFNWSVFDKNDQRYHRISSWQKMVKLFAGRDWNILGKAFKESFRFNYFIILLGSVVFHQVLESSPGIKEMSAWLTTTGIDPVIWAIFLPALIGMLTGITIAFIGISFPIIVALAGTSSYGIFALAYISGIIGILYSPVHVCIVLTTDYFRTTIFKVFKLMIVPAILQFLTGIAIWLFLTWFKP
jgi:hypothetical protein